MKKKRKDIDTEYENKDLAYRHIKSRIMICERDTLWWYDASVDILLYILLYIFELAIIISWASFELNWQC